MSTTEQVSSELCIPVAAMVDNNHICAGEIRQFAADHPNAQWLRTIRYHGADLILTATRRFSS